MNNLVRLVPIQHSDTNLIVKWRNNPRVRNCFVFQEQFTVEMHENWLNTKVDSGEVIQFIVRTIDANVPIGSVYLRDIDYSNLSAEYGIFLGEDFAVGKGYGTEACRLMTDFAFIYLGLKKLFLRVFEDNVAAIKSYRRNGFVENGGTESCRGRTLIFMEKICSNVIC